MKVGRLKEMTMQSRIMAAALSAAVLACRNGERSSNVYTTGHAAAIPCRPGMGRSEDNPPRTVRPESARGVFRGQHPALHPHQVNRLEESLPPGYGNVWGITVCTVIAQTPGRKYGKLVARGDGGSRAHRDDSRRADVDWPVGAGRDCGRRRRRVVVPFGALRVGACVALPPVA